MYLICNRWLFHVGKYQYIHYTYLPLMHWSKWHVILTVPISSKGHNLKLVSELIDDRYHFFSACDSKTSSVKKAILDVNDQKSFFITSFFGFQSRHDNDNDVDNTNNDEQTFHPTARNGHFRFEKKKPLWDSSFSFLKKSACFVYSITGKKVEVRARLLEHPAGRPEEVINDVTLS